MQKPRLAASAAVVLLSAAPALAAPVVAGFDLTPSTTGGAAAFNEFSTGTDLVVGGANSSFRFVSADGTVNNTAIFSNGTNYTVQTPNGVAGDFIARVDLTGSQFVTFDEFYLQFQRGGQATTNIVSGAAFSTDGVNYTSTTVGEVAVGLANGTENVGPYDTITDFRTPDGFGGGLGPQQVYRVGGLGAAGTLSSGSLFVRLSIGASSSSTGGGTSLTFADDRIDLTTSAIGLSAANAADGDDGLDLIFTGTASPVPEPTSLGLLGVTALGLLGRHRRRE